ncbi:MAG: cadherin-like beta sandwich domain-containing protein, partial [Bacteroidales bacterium]|nr:cadherin-like beta sandwich domain-containing protein [Bacteroidales bacterium]
MNSFKITAPLNEQFNIDWGDGNIQTCVGTGVSMSQNHLYSVSGNYNVVLTGITEDCLFTSLDFSSPIPLDTKFVFGLDLSNCTALTFLDCHVNSLQLSHLYHASQKISEPLNKILGWHYLGEQEIEVGEPVDFSEQLYFNDITTVFMIENLESSLPVNYSITNGIITFHEMGLYRVTMTNDAIVSHPNYPVYVEKDFIVTDISNAYLSTLTISNGILEPAFSSEILEYTVNVVNVEEITITAVSANSNATISGAGTFPLEIGENSFTIHVIAEDGVTEMDYTIVVNNALGVSETDLSLITLIPNPTTGELRVTSYELQVTSIEVFDIYGRAVSTHYSLLTTHYS